MTKTNILIVGAGPTGLVCALTLALNGIPVRVIDKLDNLLVGQRGATIMPRTLELYHFLGILEDVTHLGNVAPQIKQFDGAGGSKVFPMFPIAAPTPAIPEPLVYFLGQDATCRILRDALKKLGVEVEMSATPSSLDQYDSGVRATIVRKHEGRSIEEIIEAGYVVGADGAKGVVRKLVGLSFMGESRESTGFLSGDLEVHGLDNTYWHSWGVPPNDQVMLRPTDRVKENVWFLIASGPNLDRDRGVSDFEYAKQFIRQVSKQPHMDIRSPYVGLSNWKPNIRMVETFQKERIFIAGDAAHVHSPTGGQGMNSSIMDAVNLGWKLSLACKHLAHPLLLETYTEERRPVIQDMLFYTTAILNNTFDKQRKTVESPWTRPASLSMLGVHYRWSSIVEGSQEVWPGEDADYQQQPHSDGAVDHLHAGDRAPDAPNVIDARTGDSRRLFDLYKVSRHTVLIFSDQRDQVASLVERIRLYPDATVTSVVIYAYEASIEVPDTTGADIVLHDKSGHAYRGYGVIAGEPVHLAIVRPDGIIGGLARDLEGLSLYFSRIFTA
ncbi:hypothetical protein FA95DRAFT_1612889 [Auriscalpium vulgare]|uniref:Uncharacterized protein n=1 Tax=Auriscalpium vulgare TaxID=40419 RepID=A0ACB8R4Q2_9AGAM|nr:hypothetical protein FA95DRAFT_1612889 [Auriscalpium vulgare]